jgi:hypothetical protein
MFDFLGRLRGPGNETVLRKTTGCGRPGSAGLLASGRLAVEPVDDRYGDAMATETMTMMSTQQTFYKVVIACCC